MPGHKRTSSPAPPFNLVVEILAESLQKDRIRPAPLGIEQIFGRRCRPPVEYTGELTAPPYRETFVRR